MEKQWKSLREVDELKEDQAGQFAQGHQNCVKWDGFLLPPRTPTPVHCEIIEKFYVGWYDVIYVLSW